MNNSCLQNNGMKTFYFASTPGQEKKEDRLVKKELLKNNNFSDSEIERIAVYYEKHIDKLERSPEPLHIRKNSENNLPRSVVYIPKGTKKGFYLLLKTKNGLQEVGYGASNRLTLALDIECGGLKVFRSAKRDDVSETEINVNKIFKKKSDFLATGPSISYKGNWRPRNQRSIGDKKTSFSQEKNIEKLSFIIDFFEEKDLFDYKNKIQTYSEIVSIGKKIIQAIQKLHKKNFVHQDLKPENIFITKNGSPRIGDFGQTQKKGAAEAKVGSGHYMAPEFNDSNAQIASDFSSDIWSLGAILAFLKPNAENAWWWLEDNESRFETKKKKFLPEWDNLSHLDYIINTCLQIDPKKRPPIQQVAYMMNQISNNFL